MSERQKYYNSFYAPVVGWEKQLVEPSSKQFTVSTQDMVLLSSKPGLVVKPTLHPIKVWKWVKVLNRPVDLLSTADPMNID